VGDGVKLGVGELLGLFDAVIDGVADGVLVIVPDGVAEFVVLEDPPTVTDDVEEGVGDEVGVGVGTDTPKMPKLSMRAVEDVIVAESTEMRQQKDAH
jgi:hypothetical protein